MDINPQIKLMIRYKITYLNPASKYEPLNLTVAWFWPDAVTPLSLGPILAFYVWSLRDQANPGLSIDKKRLSENLTLVVGHMPTKPSCAIHSKELKTLDSVSPRETRSWFGEKKTRVFLPKQYPRKRCALDIDTPFKMKWSSNFSESLSLSKMYEIMHPRRTSTSSKLDGLTPPMHAFLLKKLDPEYFGYILFY
ncbi:hypothetical protein DSO57_1034685 [Entomophthora muscae]|uniref:Uncharacterized protein n=1 Tax=Entomophthora muscae TaxID=34485 RepID=A0ACC2S1W5_9FUNG|nr:hypothetical protein DSO57_1034685 [Entomophthora muscae]